MRWREQPPIQSQPISRPNERHSRLHKLPCYGMQPQCNSKGIGMHDLLLMHHHSITNLKTILAARDSTSPSPALEPSTCLKKLLNEFGARNSAHGTLSTPWSLSKPTVPQRLSGRWVKFKWTPPRPTQHIPANQPETPVEDTWSQYKRRVTLDS